MNDESRSHPELNPSPVDAPAARRSEETVDADQGRIDAVAAAALPALGEVPPALAQHPRYRVLKLLGRGGMGAVYLAEHRVMERTVALKVIRPDLIARPALVERFHREVKAAARLAHPNIVAAYDAEQAGDCHYLVTEYVEGTDLARWLKEQGPLPVAEACSYVRQAALGLQHAHEHQMVHRDLKPHNLMRTPSGQVKILDFGLALLPLSSEEGTETGVILGTADYMAPEQANDAHTADIRSDVYSLGCTLYQLLGGRPPFPGGGLLDKLRRQAQEEPVPLTQLRPESPAALVAIVTQMMAKDPAGRYQTPAEVAAALEPWCGALPETIDLPRQPAARRRSRSRWAVLLAGAAVVLLAGGWLAYLARERGQRAAEPPDPGLAGESGLKAGDPAPDLSQWKKVLNDDFRDPDNSVFRRVRKDHPPAELGIDKGQFVIRMLAGHEAELTKKDPRWYVWTAQERFASEDFACQVVGRVLARHDNGWALVLQARATGRSHAVRLHRDGTVEVGDGTNPVSGRSILAGPIRYPAVLPGDKFNTLLVILRGGRTLELYVNDRVIYRSIRLKDPIGKVHPGLAFWQRGWGDDKEVCAEFKRFTLWELPKSTP